MMVLVVNGIPIVSGGFSRMILLMVEILRDFVYGDMYCTTRIPIVLVYEVYIRSRRISIISSNTQGLLNPPI